MARIGLSVAPPEMLLTPEHEARTLWRIRVDVPDAPGAVARLVRALSALHVYTVGLQVVGTEDRHRTVDVVLTAPEGVDPGTILGAAMSAGRNGYITEGSDLDAQDLPTRTIDGTTRLLTDPAWGPRAARELLEAESVEVIRPNEGVDDRSNVLRLQWTPDEHVILRRSWAPFARAEQARASALLRFATTVARQAGDEDAVGWMQPIKDGRVWIRLAHPEDADALAEMHQRCSERTRYLRYVSLGEWRDVQLRRLTGGHRGATLVAMSETGSIVAIGNVFPDQDQPLRAAEIALLVEDAYQARGVGSALLRRQIALAERLGFREVVAVVLAENSGMLHLLERTPLSWTSSIEAGVATWRAPLPAPEPKPRHASG
jgi:RimJ/RimL family protein N-acetyltransferase